MKRRVATTGAARLSTKTPSVFKTYAFKNISSRSTPLWYSTGKNVYSKQNAFLGLTAAVGIAGGVTLYASQQNKPLYCEDKVPFTGLPGTRYERTFIAVKPDGVQRGLIGEIIARFERRGYKLVALKLVYPTEDFARKHYADLSRKPFFPGLVKFFSSGPVVAMVWEGKNSVKGGRALVGATNPDDSLPGSIRGDLFVEVGRNIVHGSDSPESAKNEISLWFTEAEVARYELNNAKSVYES